MALDYLGIVSYGTYPTPTPTDAVRSRLAVSMGLLTFEFPAAAVTYGTIIGSVIGSIIGTIVSKLIR